MGFQKKTIYVISISFLISIFISVKVLAVPEGVRIMQKLKSEPVENHQLIYSDILRDTSVLTHSGLRKEIIKIAREVWYKRYIKGNYFEDVPVINTYNFQAKSIKFKDIERPWKIHRTFLKVISTMSGKDFIKSALWVLPKPRSGGTESVINNLQMKLVKSGKDSLFIWLKRIDYSESKNTDYSKSDYRLISSSPTISRPMYEIVRRVKDDLNSGRKKQIKKLLWDLITDEQLPGMKKFAIASLLEFHVELNEIRAKLKYMDIKRKYSDGEVTVKEGEFLKEIAIKNANQWRSEYPKWPIDKSDVDDDRHKNDRGKGHDKQKGQGHDTQKGQGH